jgi:predicted dehydrogenase
VRILIAGLGAIGQRHARNLRALCGNAFELTAYRSRGLTHVVTETLGRDDAHDVEQALGIAASFADLDTALAAKPDAVFVCTPTSLHLSVALRAAEAGCHVFVEKPVSHTLDGVTRLAAAVRRHSLVAVVGCQWRFHPCVVRLRDMLARGTLGSLETAEIDYAEYLPDWHPYEDYRESYAARSALGGGVVLTQIHDYDLAWWLFGPVSSVRATGGHLSDLEIDVEDTVEATLAARSCPVTVRQSFAARPPRRTVTVRGALGVATLDLFAATLVVSPVPAESLAVPGYQRNEMFRAEAENFLACVAGRAEPVAPLADGIAVLTVAIGVKESMTTGRAVEIT